MVTTFTRRAANELGIRVVERSDELLRQSHQLGMHPPDPHVHDLRIGTIHSLCDELLAEFDLSYMEAGTQVIDEFETQVRLARVHRFALGYGGATRQADVIDRLIARDELVSLFRAPWDDATWPSNNFDRVNFLISLLSQHTETWVPRCQAGGKLNGIERSFEVPGLTADLILLHDRWKEYLQREHILDYAAVQESFLLGQDSVIPEVSHVFVDEFQDTNPIQLAIHLGWLRSPGMRLTIVGDDDQSIYRFRGSDLACFTGLEEACRTQGTPFRQERLETNFRSTRTIASFAESFRESTVLREESMGKKIQPPVSAAIGVPVRLLQGPWPDLCQFVASEVDGLGAGQPPADDKLSPSAAILMFSTSERVTRRGAQAAAELRDALLGQGLRVYNPRNKTAAALGSPVYEMTALISYLIDPVAMAPAGRNGRSVQVWASCGDPHKASFAPTEVPPFPISTAHASIQKGFIRFDGDIGAPGLSSRDLLEYVDKIRELLIVASGAQRLTLSGLVSRLLSFPRFRSVGFSSALFRQALFTRLLEANIAPTRLTMHSLDRPLRPERRNGKVNWPTEVWSFLNVFGSLIQETRLDDVEVEELAESAVALLTFHQVKGLEFDYVYLGMTGREADIRSSLRTLAFSGETVAYRVDANGQPETSDARVLRLSKADREREIYVAITRAIKQLTVLHDPDDQRPMAGLNQGLGALFSQLPSEGLKDWPSLSQRSFQCGT
jgi:DNA helicase-2/ATP-dependent DNA helicase PcrA